MLVPRVCRNRPMLKRIFDIVVSLCALGLLWPLMLVIAVLVYGQMGSPVLFRQQRPGLNAVPFTLYKFRTMREGTGPDSERLTGFGRMLRATSLDELPEFWNVLRGDMSLVGPRPLLMEYLDYYSEEEARRHEVRPGITGLAQIRGRNNMSWEQKLHFDVSYVDHRSFWLDLKLLLMTPYKVLCQHGVNKSGHATTDRFTESKP